MQASLAARLLHRRASGFPASQIAVLFCLLMLLISVPIWTHPVPPLSDYANHLARMHVIARIGTDPVLANFYQVDWQIIPNLMMDLVVPLLARFMPIYVAGQVFTLLTFVLIVSGIMALSRSLFGRWSAVPLMATPLLFNYVFLVGVMNYVFGIGLALWALAGWIWLRDRALPLRLLLATAFVIALFFCHLFAVGLFGLGMLAHELWRLHKSSEKPLMQRLAVFASGGLPFLPALLMLWASPTMHLVSDVSWEPRGKIDGLMYVIELYSDIVTFVLAATLAAALTWVVRRRLLRVHPMAWALLLVGAAVYLALPRIMFATYMTDQRLPIALAFILIGCIDVSLHHSLVRRGFIAVLLTLVTARVIEVNVVWANLSTITAEFRGSVKRIRPGSKVLVAYGSATAGEDVVDLGLVHAACLAIIERSALVTTAFTVVGKQVLQVRPPYRNLVDTEDGTPPSLNELLLAAEEPIGEDEPYWHGWTTRYDYLYVLFTDDDAENPDPERLTLVQNGSRFQLYRIKAPPPPIAAKQ